MGTIYLLIVVSIGTYGQTVHTERFADRRDCERAGKILKILRGDIEDPVSGRIRWWCGIQVAGETPA